MQFVVLMAMAWNIDAENQITQRDLAVHARLSKALLSQILKSLMRKELVKQTRMANDTRVRLLKLTKRGETKVSDALSILEIAEDQFWHGMSDQAKNLRKALLAILERKAREGIRG